MTAIKAWKGNPNFEDSRSLHSCPGLRSLVWTVEFNQHIPFIFLTDARLSMLTLDFVPHTCLSVMTIMNFAASKIFGAIQLYKLHSTNHSCSFKKKRSEDDCWYYFGSFISMMHGRRKHAKSSSIIICGWGCTTTSAKHTSSPHHIVTSESGLINLQRLSNSIYIWHFWWVDVCIRPSLWYKDTYRQGRGQRSWLPD